MTGKRVAKPQKPKNADKLFPLLLASDDSESLLNAGKIALQLFVAEEKIEEWTKTASSLWESEKTRKALDEVRQIGRDMMRIYCGYIPCYRKNAPGKDGEMRVREIKKIIKEVDISLELGNGEMDITIDFADRHEDPWTPLIPGKHYGTNDKEWLEIFLVKLRRALPYYLASDWERVKFYIAACPRCGKIFEKRRGDQLYDRDTCRNETARK